MFIYDISGYISIVLFSNLLNTKPVTSYFYTLKLTKLTLYFYYEIQDYTQYYLDIRQANGDGYAIWDVEYRFTDTYNVTDISVESMEEVAVNLGKDKLLLQKYAIYNSVSYSFETCGEKCQRNHLCAINYLDIERYENCVALPASGDVKVAAGCDITCVILLTIAGIALIAIPTFVFVYTKQKKVRENSKREQSVDVEEIT